MELWDLLDKDRKPLGRTHNRKDPMIEGEYHIVVEVITVNSEGQLLITLRDPNKETNPDFWEYTGGSAVSGEDSREAAIRELFEETGISVKPEDLSYLGTVMGRTAIIDTYIIVKDIRKSEIVLQEGETVDSKIITFSEFNDMIARGIVAPPVVRRFTQMKDKIYQFVESSTSAEL